MLILCIHTKFFIIDSFENALSKEKTAQNASNSEAEILFNKNNLLKRKHPVQFLTQNSQPDYNSDFKRIRSAPTDVQNKKESKSGPKALNFKNISSTIVSGRSEISQPLTISKKKILNEKNMQHNKHSEIPTADSVTSIPNTAIVQTSLKLKSLPKAINIQEPKLSNSSKIKETQNNIKTIHKDPIISSDSAASVSNITSIHSLPLLKLTSNKVINIQEQSHEDESSIEESEIKYEKIATVGTNQDAENSLSRSDFTPNRYNI